MCSRFEMNARPAELARRFTLDGPPPVPNRAEVRPSDLALTIDETRMGRLLVWGLAVSWSRAPLINARAESLEDKPTFRALLGRRCLIPAEAWFEWRPLGRQKLKNRFCLKEGGLFALAGLQDGEKFAIVTCDAPPDLAAIHDRAPAVLERDAEAAWLDGRIAFAEVKGLLAPCPPRLLRIEEESPVQGDLFNAP